MAQAIESFTPIFPEHFWIRTKPITLAIPIPTTVGHCKIVQEEMIWHLITRDVPELVNVNLLMVVLIKVVGMG
jgi:hypothetical protein